MSIATMRGDGGETALASGLRVRKSDVRVETCGTIDELISTLGFARSICEDAGMRALTRTIQKELFAVCSGVSMPAVHQQPVPVVPDAMVDALTAHVHRIEATEGLLADWSIPGDDAAAAAYDVARTVCRRAERLISAQADAGAAIDPNVLRYVNRLSDLLWLFGRQLEMAAGVNAALRGPEKGGPRWSRAW
jgi:cob(I)alamin adenosyltransferase